MARTISTEKISSTRLIARASEPASASTPLAGSPSGRLLLVFMAAVAGVDDDRVESVARRDAAQGPVGAGPREEGVEPRQPCRIAFSERVGVVDREAGAGGSMIFTQSWLPIILRVKGSRT